MKEKILSGFLLFLFVLSASGQKGRISGMVLDRNSGEGIPFATIALKGTSGSSPLKGTASDSDGSFNIDGLALGTYHLEVSFIGYETEDNREVVISADRLHVDLGEIELGLSSIALEEAEVRGMAATVSTKIDRKVYRVADFGTAAGGTASDVLNKLPSVSVNPDGVVTVRGTADFVVYLNGKPTQMDPSQLLAQISSDAIKSIEVITVPTARFDSQGKGGIININTYTRGMEGLSVNVNGLLGGAPWGNLTGPYSGFSQNDNRHGGGASILYMKENFSAAGGLYYNHRRVNGRRTGDARLLQEDGSYYHMVASGERPEWYENFSANAGFEYAMDGGSALSGSYYFGKRTEGRSAFYVYDNYYGDEDKQAIDGVPVDEDWVYNPNTDIRYGIFHVLNLDYTKVFDASATLKISGLYEHSGLSRALDNRNFDFEPVSETVGGLEAHFRQTDDTPLDGLSLSVEFEKDLDKGQSIGLGFQPQLLTQSGPFTYDTLNVASGNWGAYGDLVNAIDLQRAIYAGYFDYSVSTEKLSLIAGLRLEYTDQVLDIENPDYFSIFDRETKGRYEVKQLDWFPTLHLNYLLSDKSELTLAGSRRISRPPTKNMAPFLYRRHFEVYVVGDPALKPEYLNLAELTLEHELGKQQIGLTGFYRGTNNAIFRVNTVYEQENVLIRSYTNSGNTTALGAELNANLVLGSRTKFFIGGSLYNYRVDADIFGYQEDNSSTNWSLKGNMNLALTKTLKLTVDLDVKSATVTAQGRNELFYMANSALSFTPQKMNGWEFSLKVLDFLSSNITGLNTRAYDMAGVQIFYQETEYLRQGPIVEVSLSYAFNSKSRGDKKAESTFGKEQF